MRFGRKWTLTTGLLTALVWGCPKAVSAHDFAVWNGQDSIWYEIVDDQVEMAVEVTFEGRTYRTVADEYAGNLVVPSSIVYAGQVWQVVGVGSNAFCNCRKLRSVVLPEGIRQIGAYAFAGCDSLASIQLPEHTLTDVGAYAFMGCAMLRDVALPQTLHDIGVGALNGTSVDHVLQTDSIFVFLPRGYQGCYEVRDGIAHVAPSAFDSCASLTCVVLPPTVRTIGGNAFAHAPRLSCVNLPGGLVSIGEYAFAKTPSLSSLTLPPSLRTLGKYAFVESGLRSVIVPGGLTDWGYGTFTLCDSLHTAVVSEPLQEVAPWSFRQCHALQHVVLPATLRTVGNVAFAECSELERVVIPEGVTAINGSAFSGCKALADVVLPSTLRTIEVAAFQRCRSLHRISLPEGLESVGSNAFQATDIDSIVLPSTVQKIGANAYDSCLNLVHITSLADVPPVITSNTFSDYDKQLVVHCHALDLYRQPGIWRLFDPKDCIKAWFEIQVQTADSLQGITTCGGLYEDGSTMMMGAIAMPGYAFSHWSDGATQNPRALVVTQDELLTAYFVPSKSQLQELHTWAGVRVENGRILIENLAHRPIALYDAQGKLIAISLNDLSQQVPSGVYMAVSDGEQCKIIVP
ncbi:MAG: leucine-rich repeat domain-containing protein [Paludibacteraceae bacterium]|nr:leucine-rich repeat domain-containing protein [Paludibacteraceae bacterium]